MSLAGPTVLQVTSQGPNMLTISQSTATGLLLLVVLQTTKNKTEERWHSPYKHTCICCPPIARYFGYGDGRAISYRFSSARSRARAGPRKRE